MLRSLAVDMVSIDSKLFKPLWCVEIKWSNRYYQKTQELNSLIFFCQRNHFKATVITTIDFLGNKRIDDLDITFLPAAVYAYNIGAITLERKTIW
jgi:hypothetical protein